MANPFLPAILRNPREGYLYGLSPLCVRMCVVTLLDCENRRLHTEQRKGFSPECVRQWAVKLAACVKEQISNGHAWSADLLC